jgi:hypothetical protein
LLFDGALLAVRSSSGIGQAVAEPGTESNRETAPKTEQTNGKEPQEIRMFGADMERCLDHAGSCVSIHINGPIPAIHEMR